MHSAFLSAFVDWGCSLQLKPVSELSEIFSEVSDALEAAAATTDPLKGRTHVIQELERLRERMNIPASNGRKSDGIHSHWVHMLGLSGYVIRFGFTAVFFFFFNFLLFLSGMLQTLPLPTAKCYMFHWDKDNFGKFNGTKTEDSSC